VELENQTDDLNFGMIEKENAIERLKMEIQEKSCIISQLE